MKHSDLIKPYAWRRGVWLLTLIFLAHPTLAQWGIDPHLNTAIVTEENDQSWPTIVSDDTGGAIIVWQDFRNGIYNDIYSQRIDRSGKISWVYDGVPISTAANHQSNTKMISDGVGGAIMVWQDSRNGSSITYDIYAQRINAAGQVQWADNGVPISIATNNQFYPQLISDDNGGAIIVWQDEQNNASTNFDIYAQRVNAAGQLQWAENGVPISTATESQYRPQLTGDGEGGAIIVWQDHRNNASTSADIYVQRVNAAGQVQWAENGVPISTAKGVQISPQLISDEAGGAIIVWRDSRNNSDIYAQRVNGAGQVLWTINGAAISTDTHYKYRFQLTSDGEGGAIVVWEDNRNEVSNIYDLYAQRIIASGRMRWAENGVPVSIATDNQSYPQMISDGAGGAIIVWHDRRNNYSSLNYDIYAQRVDAAGNALWNENGIPISLSNSFQSVPQLINFGEGGAIIVWEDNRKDIRDSDIYAQAVDGYGYLGIAKPALLHVSDVPGDQGGQVTIGWEASDYDIRPYTDITAYSVWRGVNLNYTSELPIDKSGSRMQSIGGKSYRIRRINGQNTYWEFMGRVPGHYLPKYSFTVPTTSDSTAGKIPYFSFFVSAETDDPHVFWDSDIDSTYSVDNLSPERPTNLTAQLVANEIELHWNANGEEDLKGYKLYRSKHPEFNTDTMTAYVSIGDTMYTDTRLPSEGSLYYLLYALDVHGNHSLPSSKAEVVITALAKDPGTSLPGNYALDQNYPNPFNPTTVIPFSLPEQGHVSLRIYNLLGREVATLVDKSMNAGSYEIRWDARGMPGGFYVYTLKAGIFNKSRNMVLIK